MKNTLLPKLYEIACRYREMTLTLEYENFIPHILIALVDEQSTL